MIKYFNDDLLIQSKNQRKRVLTIFFVILSVYLAVSIGLFVWYTTLPYQSPTIMTIKIIHYSLTIIMAIFSVIYLGIAFKRVNRFYKLVINLATGIRETSTGSFLDYDENLHDKDGVDCKALVFIEWNKYKNDYFERKVLVFYEFEFPKFTPNANVKYITQGNFLISYEILDNPINDKGEQKL